MNEYMDKVLTALKFVESFETAKALASLDVSNEEFREILSSYGKGGEA